MVFVVVVFDALKWTLQYSSPFAESCIPAFVPDFDVKHTAVFESVNGLVVVANPSFDIFLRSVEVVSPLL